jgi:dihydropteroate synthase
MFTLNCKGKLVVIDKPTVMGIINITPDSFHAGSRKQGREGILAQAEKMINDGATILDIGGQSTRPGAELISAEAEMERVLPAIEAIHQTFPEVIMSIDTFYASVAKSSVEAGCSMVNDVSGGMMDAEMLPIVGTLRVPYICMHIQGTPANMQAKPHYENVVKEILDFLIGRVEACRLAGIQDVIIDPGIGFGKTMAHNYELIKQLSVFKMLGKPILLGISRKGFIRKSLGVETADALNGTTVLNTIGLMNGATILRVHDVKEAVEAVKLYLEVYGR